VKTYCSVVYDDKRDNANPQNLTRKKNVIPGIMIIGNKSTYGIKL